MVLKHNENNLPEVIEYRYVPVQGFLAYLLEGWRLPLIVEPGPSHHGSHSVILERTP